MMDVEAILPAPFAWVEIPGGKVTLEDASSYGGTVGGEYRIEGFAIAKYPTTDAQYQVFVDAKDGYADRRWWNYSEAAKAWREVHSQPKGTAFGGDDRPRTNVCWYDSVAFCGWLSGKTSQKITLPTEQQWQRAAQGDDGRMYPWGDVWECGRCNSSVPPCESQQTSPVRQYEGRGDSPFRVVDMAGNVWEWCLSAWGADDVDLSGHGARAVRGGSWGDARIDFRTVDRGRNDPQGEYSQQGFRCARG